MKSILTSIAVGIIVFGMIFLIPYLSVSFYNTDTNFKHWQDEGRAIVAIFGIMFGFILGIIAGVCSYQFQKDCA
jgi:hypothetical protein